ncbi:MAG: enoyl-CoA hydratase/isomerase family protein [Thermodesulfobacteriota bacterium]
MARMTSLNEDNLFFTAAQEAELAVLRLKDNPLRRAIDLKSRDVWLEYLELVDRTAAVKVLMIVGWPHKTGREEFGLILHHIAQARSDPDNIIRLCNSFNQFILGIVGLSKTVVHVDSGRVISPFLDLSLACDWRIVADNTVFEKAHLDWGLAPKGGSAYFLTKMLGLNQARRVLLSDTDITAYQARKIGIVDQVAPLEDLEKTAYKAAHRLAQKQARSATAIKRLLNYNLKDLRDYLDYENQEILRLVTRPDFGKGL